MVGLYFDEFTLGQTSRHDSRCTETEFGPSHDSLCPYQAFEAADGPVMIGFATNHLWKKFCAVVGPEANMDDPRFATNADRVTHRAETLAIVSEAIARKPVDYLDKEFAKVRVPCLLINYLQQMTNSPHTTATGILMNYEHPTAGSLRAVAEPVRIDGAPRAVDLPLPLHSTCIDRSLDELSLSGECIEELRTTRVVY